MAGILGYAREEAGRHESQPIARTGILDELPRADGRAVGRRRPAAGESHRHRERWQARCGWPWCGDCYSNVAVRWRSRTPGTRWAIAEPGWRDVRDSEARNLANRGRPLCRTTEAIAPAEHHQLRHPGAGAPGSSGNRLPAFSICRSVCCFKWRAITERSKLGTAPWSWTAMA